MVKNNSLYTTIAAVAILVAIIVAVLIAGSKDASANAYTQTNIGAASTTAAFSVTTSARILATSTANTQGGRYTRVYATICNPNVNPVYIALNNDKAATLTDTTAVIAAAAGYEVCYEITDRNGYQGSITASSTNQTATSITVSDYFQ